MANPNPVLLRRGVTEYLALAKATTGDSILCALPVDLVSQEIAWQMIPHGTVTTFAANLLGSLDGVNFAPAVLSTSSVVGGDLKIVNIQGISHLKINIATLTGGGNVDLLIRCC